jgi:hypothetical protein
VDNVDVELRVRNLALAFVAGPVPQVVRDVRRVLVAHHHGDRRHVEAVPRQLTDLAHEAEELVEAVVHARHGVVARGDPDEILIPVLVDLVPVAGAERLVGLAHELGRDLRRCGVAHRRS